MRRPEIRAPGRAAAETAGNVVARFGDAGVDTAGEDRIALDIEGVVNEGVGRGVAEGDGDATSTTHIRWERVATSLATVCASVEKGVTWKTVVVLDKSLNLNYAVCLPGNESFPSPIPRSLRITEMKWIQLDFNNGKLLLFVSSLTSAVEILPTTFNALSTTATLVSPSLLINCRASVKVRSPLESSALSQIAVSDNHT